MGIKKGLRIAGVFLISSGLAIILHPGVRTTGYVVSENIDNNPFTLSSIIFIVLGFIALFIGIERKKQEKTIKSIIEEGLKDSPIE